MRTNNLFKGLLALVAAVLLAGGCSNDKVIPGDDTGPAITFRVQDDIPSSRAATTTAGQVNAFVVNAQADAAVPAAERTVFDAVTVSRKEGAANSFDYAPKRYYPDAAEKVAFSAYSPVSSHIGAGFQGNAGNSISYTVPAPLASGAASQEDLLVAHTVTGRQVANGLFPPAVALQFRHALARIYVKAANSLTEPVRVTGLGLHNLYTQGTLDVDRDTWKTADNGTVDINEAYQTVDNTGKYKVLWQPAGSRNGRYAYTLAEADATISVRTSTPLMLLAKEKGMFVLPQTTLNQGGATTVDDGDFYLSVAFEVSNYDDELKIPFSDLAGLGGGLTFEMGRTYALTLSFAESDNLINVRFQLEVEGWEEPPVTQFHLAFDPNGGFGPVPTEDTLLWVPGAPHKVVIPNNPYYRQEPDIYYFLGWSTEPDGVDTSVGDSIHIQKGALYLPGDTITVSAATTLYAQWSLPEQTTLNFPFKGRGEFVGIVQDKPGIGYSYKLECWGAGSNNSSKGSYTSGEISLNWQDMLYPFAGGKNTWNGGGASGNNNTGAGSTDFRLAGGNWNADRGLQSRIMVAAGAGGNKNNASPGGGLVAYSSYSYQIPATQTKGGYMKPTMHYTFPHVGYFGYGSNGSHYDNDVYSGGGGWYGGSGGNNGGEGGSTGGSSFISGMTGCVAIASPVTRIPASGDETWYYLGSPPDNPQRFGVNGWRYQERTSGNISVMTIGGRDYIFTHPSMVDGQGYQWNTGSRETTPSYQMPKPDGGMYDSSEKGHTGHGYARITLLGD